MIIINFSPLRVKTTSTFDLSVFATKYVLLAIDLLNVELIPSCKFQLTEFLCKQLGSLSTHCLCFIWESG